MFWYILIGLALSIFLYKKFKGFFWFLAVGISVVYLAYNMIMGMLHQNWVVATINFLTLLILAYCTTEIINYEDGK